MNDMKSEAIKIIEAIPDENMKYVLRSLKSLQEEFKPVDPEEKKRESQAAWARIQSILADNPVKVPEDFDYKKELAQYRDERYGYL